MPEPVPSACIAGDLTRSQCRRTESASGRYRLMYSILLYLTYHFIMLFRLYLTYFFFTFQHVSDIIQI